MKSSKILKRTGLLIAAMSLMVLLAGCGGNFAVTVNEDLNVEITAENADADMTGGAGTFTVGEGETAVIEPDLEEGVIQVEFVSFDGAEDPDLNAEEAAEAAEPAFAVEISGTEPVQCDLASGDYMVNATVMEAANGTALIRAEKD